MTSSVIIAGLELFQEQNSCGIVCVIVSMTIMGVIGAWEVLNSRRTIFLGIREYDAQFYSCLDDYFSVHELHECVLSAK